jgi:hypothetical protein
MSLTAEQVLDAIAPSFRSSPSKAVFLEMATLRTSAEFFGDRYPQAVAYRAAHMLQLSARSGGASGMVSSHSVGEISESFAPVGTTNDSDLSQTTYGAMLVSLRRACAPAGLVGGLY